MGTPRDPRIPTDRELQKTLAMGFLLAHLSVPILAFARRTGIPVHRLPFMSSLLMAAAMHGQAMAYEVHAKHCDRIPKGAVVLRHTQEEVAKVAVKVEWMQCQADNWCPFDDLDLSTVDSEGVYIIGCEYEGHIITVYVGQGDVADRIDCHRSNDEITEYRESGPLYVTWADVSARRRDGVERFLADELDPLVGSAHPDVDPIEVNLPGNWC